MKKSLMILIVAALMIAMIPVSVFAAAPQELRVDVRNRAGAEVDLRLTDADGNFIFMTLTEGVTDFTLMEGEYEYYAVLPCGIMTGTWNVNVVKTLFISCHNGATFNLDVLRAGVGCKYFGYMDGDLESAIGGAIGVTDPDIYLVDGNSANYESFREYAPDCIDPYMDLFYSMIDWQIWLFDEVGDYHLFDEYIP